MAITAQSLIRRVVETLQDNTSIRWPVAELVRYLNDGQREVAIYRPDAVRVSGPQLDAFIAELFERLDDRREIPILGDVVRHGAKLHDPRPRFE